MLRDRLLEVELEDGREERLQIFGAGTILHHTGSVQVDADFVEGLRSSLEALRSRYGYYPPLTAEHPAMLGDLIGEPDVDGVQYGLVTSVEAEVDGSVSVVVRLNKLGGWLFDMGALTYFSPSIYREWTDPHSGEVFGPVLREVSAVGVPHNKNISSSRIASVYDMSESTSLNPIGFRAQPIDQEVDMEETLAKILALLEQLVSEEKSEAEEMPEEEAAPAMADGEEEEAAPMSDEAEEMEEAEKVAMSERVRMLELKLRKAETIALVRADLPHVDETTVEDLAVVRMSDEARYSRLVSMIPGTQTQTIGTASAPRSSSVSMSDSRVVSYAEEAASAGIPRGASLIRFLQAKGMSGEAIEAAFQDAGVKARISNVYKARGLK